MNQQTGLFCWYFNYWGTLVFNSKYFYCWCFTISTRISHWYFQKIKQWDLTCLDWKVEGRYLSLIILNIFYSLIQTILSFQVLGRRRIPILLLALSSDCLHSAAFLLFLKKILLLLNRELIFGRDFLFSSESWGPQSFISPVLDQFYIDVLVWRILPLHS